MTTKCIAGFITLLALTLASAEECTFDILLVDLFGDGWGNIDLDIDTGYTMVNMTANTKLNYTMPSNYSMTCGSCANVVNISTPDCFLNVSMSSRGTPIAPWEVLWVIQHNNATYFGNFDSTLQINGSDVFSSNLVDYTSAGVDSCEECEHPLPHKPTPGSIRARAMKTATKPKPAPATVLIDLIDQLGDGESFFLCCYCPPLITIGSICIYYILYIRLVDDDQILVNNKVN
jgi:hypothetical protein